MRYDYELCIFGKSKVVHQIADYFENNHLGFQKSFVLEPTRRKPPKNLDNANFYLRVRVTEENSKILRNYIKLKNQDVKMTYMKISYTS